MLYLPLACHWLPVVSHRMGNTQTASDYPSVTMKKKLGAFKKNTQFSFLFMTNNS